MSYRPQVAISHDKISGVSSSDHHTKYTDSEAITAINDDVDHGSTASHNYASSPGDVGLSNVPNEDATDPANWDPAKIDGNFLVGNGASFVAENGSTARTSLGLGTAATHSDSDYADASHNHDGTYLNELNNLSDLPDKSTSRLNLGLGSASERAVEDVLTDGSNLPDGAAIKAYGDTNWGGSGRTLVTKTASYTANSGEIILADSSSGAFTVSLPTPSANALIDVKKIGASGNSVTIDTSGSETIDGSSTKILSEQYVSLSFVSDGSNWFIL